jgi:hypothetical protein
MHASHQETATEMKTGTTTTDVHLRGWMLFVARAIWLAFAFFYLILFIINLLQPLYGHHTLICPLFSTCPYDATTLQALQQAHISLAAYTIYEIAFGLLFALIPVGFSVLLFWRMSDQPVGLFASIAFLSLGSGALTGDLSRLPSAFQVILNIQVLCVLWCLGFFLVTFPDGRFVPRWGWLIGLTLFVQAILFMLPGPFNQTKWVIFGLVSFLLLLLLQGLTTPFISPTSVAGALFFLASPVLPTLGFLLIPSSITMAILRSRLWEIDVLINRTLVYGTLSISLALVYVGLIFGLQYLLRGIISQNNDVAIVVSTLAIAALFQPLRHRIQAIIDHRFYRRKYDAAKILEAFGTTLRNEVDLNQLREHLLNVVQETMQPAHVSLWLRKPDSKLPRPDGIPPRHLSQ